MLDPRKILDFIDLWHKNPNTPLPELNLTPGQSHILTAFINEEKWKFEKARQVKKAQYKKEHFLKNNVVKMSPEELVTMQAEIKALSDEFHAYRADWLGAKVRFVRMAKGFTPNVAASSQPEIPQTGTSAQSAEENESTRADEELPVSEENARATASVVPEEIQPISSAPHAPMTSINLPSATEAKKTKAAERAAMKKRKASASSESSAPKKVKTLTSSSENPIDVVPISSMPSKEIIPFGEEYAIPSESAEEVPSAASTEQLDEEIDMDNITSTPLVSSPMPQFTAEEAGVEEIDDNDEDVDIGSTTPILNDDFWESHHPNSPLTTPLHQVPQSPVPTEEIHTGSNGPQSSLQSIPEEVPAASAEAMETKAAADTATEIPQPVAPVAIPQEAVKTSTINL
jgi:hypothetical protein